MDLSWAMNQDAVFRKHTDKDGWGKPTFEPDVELKVRWQFKQKLVQAANGDEVMSEAEVWAPPIVNSLHIAPVANDVFVYDDIGGRGKQCYKIVATGTPVGIYGETGHHKVFCISIPADQGGGLD